MYGGSMFARSNSTETQSMAIQSVNERWGEGIWCGRETIGVAVCKKKYAPFAFSIVAGRRPSEKVVKVERMFGCRCHTDLRREKIELHGERTGWEPFGQWSMRKAKELARRETERINGGAAAAASSEDDSSTPPPEVVTSDEELRSICHNGKCTWKLRGKYDDVHRELTGYSSSDAES